MDVKAGRGRRGGWAGRACRAGRMPGGLAGRVGSQAKADMPDWQSLNDNLAHSRLWQVKLLGSRNALLGFYLRVRQFQKVLVLSNEQLGDCQGNTPTHPLRASV